MRGGEGRESKRKRETERSRKEGKRGSRVVVQVDYYRMCVLPMLKKLLPDNGLELKVHTHTHTT